jgi:Ca2+-binding EF-hand superfamily protein
VTPWRLYYKFIAKEYGYTFEQINQMTMYQLRTLMGKDEDMQTARTFQSVGDRETGIITASDFKAMYEAEAEQEYERFVDRLMERISKA